MSRSVGVELRNLPIVGLLREILFDTQKASDDVFKYQVVWLDQRDGDESVNEIDEGIVI